MNYAEMSVAIPYHGRADFFKETLETLLNQTCKNFEIVISDDSNNENDLSALDALVKEFGLRGLKISVVRTKPNLGAILNTRQAVDACKNDIVRILHTDDCLAPKTIELELEIFNKFPDTFFAFHNLTVFREKFIPNENNSWSDKTWVDNWLKDKNYINSIIPSCLVFNKKVLAEVGFFNTEFEFMYDWEYQIRLFEYAYLNNKRVVEIEAGYVGWRISKMSESYTKSMLCYRDSRNIIKLMKKSYAKIGKRLNISKKGIKRFKRIFDNRIEQEASCSGANSRLPLRLYPRKIFHFLSGSIKSLCDFIKKTQAKNAAKSALKAQAPLVFDDNYLSYSKFPMYAKDVKIAPNFDDIEKTAIVICGSIVEENNFTYETALLYKKFYKNKNADIILSTYADTDEALLNDFRALGVEIVLSDKIRANGIDDINHKITLAKYGIDKADTLKCKYVLKTDTDDRFYNPDTLLFLINLLKQYSKNAKSELKNRIIACSKDSFLHRFYGISSKFLFGELVDIKKYWNVEFDNSDHNELKTVSNKECFIKHSGDTYVLKHFLKNIKHELKDDINDSLEVYANYFVIIDKEQINLYRLKKSNKTSQYDFYFPNLMKECLFLDWFNLYSNKDKIKSNLSDFK